MCFTWFKPVYTRLSRDSEKITAIMKKLSPPKNPDVLVSNESNFQEKLDFINNRAAIVCLYQYEKNELYSFVKQLTAKSLIAFAAYVNFYGIHYTDIEDIYKEAGAVIIALSEGEFANAIYFSMMRMVLGLIKIGLKIIVTTSLNFDICYSNVDFLRFLNRASPIKISLHDMTLDELQLKYREARDVNKFSKIIYSLMAALTFCYAFFYRSNVAETLTTSFILSSLISLLERRGWLGYDKKEHYLSAINRIISKYSDCQQDKFSEMKGYNRFNYNFGFAEMQIEEKDKDSEVTRLELFEIINNALISSEIDVVNISEEYFYIQFVLNEKLSFEVIKKFNKSLKALHKDLVKIKKIESEIKENFLRCFNGLLESCEEPTANNQWQERVLNSNGSQSVYVYLACVDHYVSYWENILKNLKIVFQEFAISLVNSSQQYLTLSIDSTLDFDELKKKISNITNQIKSWDRLIKKLSSHLLPCFNGLLQPYRRQQGGEAWYYQDNRLFETKFNLSIPSIYQSNAEEIYTLLNEYFSPEEVCIKDDHVVLTLKKNIEHKKLSTKFEALYKMINSCKASLNPLAYKLKSLNISDCSDENNNKGQDQVGKKNKKLSREKYNMPATLEDSVKKITDDINGEFETSVEYEGAKYWGVKNPSRPQKAPTLFFAVSPDVRKDLPDKMYDSYCDLVKNGARGTHSCIRRSNMKFAKLGKDNGEAIYDFKLKLSRKDARLAARYMGNKEVDGRMCFFYSADKVFDHGTQVQYVK